MREPRVVVLLALVAGSLAAGPLLGAGSIEDPGPHETLVSRSAALVHGAGRAAHLCGLSIAFASACLLARAVLFAREAHAVAPSHGLPFRGAARRAIAAAAGLVGVAACTIRVAHAAPGLDLVARFAPVVLASALAVAIVAVAASARQDETTRRGVSRLVLASAWLGVLAVTLAAAWAPLAEVASLQLFADGLEPAPLLGDWLTASAHLSQRAAHQFEAGLPFVLPVLAAVLLLAAARGAWGGLERTSGFSVAAIAGVVAVGVSGQRALAVADRLSWRFGRAFAGTYLPVTLGAVDLCGPLVQADVLAVGESRVTLGGVDMGPTPVEEAECQALAWKLVERARSRKGHGPAPFERLAWVGGDRNVSCRPVGCVVRALERIVRQGRAAAPGPWRSAPRMYWVGEDDTRGLRCSPELLVDPSEPRCEHCELEKRVELQLVDEDKFTLLWKIGGTVIESIDIERGTPSGAPCPYPSLLRRADSEWRVQGSHMAPEDRARDLAVVFASSKAAFVDAVNAAGCVAQVERPVREGDWSGMAPAFDVWMLPW
jgi:hypothetical protein